MSRTKQFIYIIALSTVGLLLLGIFYYAGFDKANTPYQELRGKVADEAHNCHVFRDLGFNAVAMASTRQGSPWPIKDCTRIYALLGEKEPPLNPDSQRLEDEEKAKIDVILAAKQAERDSKEASQH